MKHWVALLLLVVVATFLTASGRDSCGSGPSGHSERSQHILCVDDCTPILVPHSPTPPPPDSKPKSVYDKTVISPILTLDLEPEKDPPRT